MFNPRTLKIDDLLTAVEKDDLAKVKKLLKNDVDLYIQFDRGRFLTHIAAIFNSKKLYDFFFE